MVQKFSDLEIDAKTNSGVTPLMLAIKRSNWPALKALVNKGANPFEKDLLD